MNREPDANFTLVTMSDLYFMQNQGILTVRPLSLYEYILIIKVLAVHESKQEVTKVVSLVKNVGKSTKCIFFPFKLTFCRNSLEKR